MYLLNRRGMIGALCILLAIMLFAVPASAAFPTLNSGSGSEIDQSANQSASESQSEVQIVPEGEQPQDGAEVLVVPEAASEAAGNDSSTSQAEVSPVPDNSGLPTSGGLMDTILLACACAFAMLCIAGIFAWNKRRD